MRKHHKPSSRRNDNKDKMKQSKSWRAIKKFQFVRKVQNGTSNDSHDFLFFLAEKFSARMNELKHKLNERMLGLKKRGIDTEREVVENRDHQSICDEKAAGPALLFLCGRCR